MSAPVHRFRRSASGKLILLGEHAVVYGVPAVACSIPRGAQATASIATATTLQLADRAVTPDDGTELGVALAALLKHLPAPPLAIEVTLTMPAGVGLGASAAIAVAIARVAAEAAGGVGEAAVIAGANAWGAGISRQSFGSRHGRSRESRCDQFPT